ncbi:SusD/RagB family nutrient-binding outer membrane lipoprotein [Dinghuibacter silviterrae]|uniref:SusD-like starch-binding protein associating with outer membrane n=1 Tax=Dinghuibacter silviterrae TaxID=1539049 RepID=A0A4R8DE05_9BACT|nr:SusD/RagB family nutrient-binding outer membrane lipoprotein [Dinghuibacter silviterrae]TDW95719.1 SusD-like starch-binding protein associating with outer membrane [Dinghuibacter silviterrae]
MKKLTYLFLSISVLASSCVKNTSLLAVDPKSPTSVPSASLFLSAEKNLFDNYTSTSVSSAPFRVLSQEWTENTYVYEAQYNFSAYNAPDNWWANIYEQILGNLTAAKAAFPTDVPDPVTLRHSLDIADIMEVQAYYWLIATYGNVPYSQAENRTIPFPKYDDAKTIAKDLFTRLDSSIAGLAVAGGTMTSSEEQVYGGSLTAWTKFAATLKLKLAMLIADEDATTASTEALAAVATGVFSSNADNAVLAYDPSSPGNSNPLYQALVYSKRHDFITTNLLVNTMNGWADPRVPLYFQTDKNGNYTGGTPGAGNGYKTASDFSLTIQQPAFPGDLLDYTQSEFLMAEAAARGIAVGGTAASHYANAITASIEFWYAASGLTQTAADAAAATYLAQPSVAYATATGTWQQKIGYQQWIADYNMNWDSWTVIRRLGYPDLDVVNPPTGAQGNLPLRFYYPLAEQTTNSVNWKAAEATLPGGVDVVSAKLWFMP